jgi:hypothetical protein
MLKSLVLCGFFDEAESILQSVRDDKEKDADRETKRKGWCGKWLGGNKEGECAASTDSALAVDYGSWVFCPLYDRGGGVFYSSDTVA